MKYESRLDYIKVIKYFCFFLFLSAFSFLKGTATIFSIGVYSAGIALGLSPFVSPIIMILSALIIGGKALIFYYLPSFVAFIIIFFIYKAKKRKIGLEIAIYAFLSTLLYVFYNTTLPLNEKITEAVITALISLTLFLGGGALIKKGLKYKFCYQEIFTIFLSITLFGLGISHLVSPNLWKALSVAMILLTCFVYKTGKSVLIALVLGLSLAVYYKNLNYVSLYLIWTLVVESLMPISRFLSALSVLAVDYVVHVVFGVFGAYSISKCVPVLIGICGFCCTPKRFLTWIRDKISLFKDKQLTRLTINRNRLSTSNKLYEISGIFLEIASSVSNEKQSSDCGKSKVDKITNKIINEVCKDCTNNKKCPAVKTCAGLLRATEIGVAKGKLSFIDLPQSLSSVCIRPSEIIFGLNKKISQLKELSVEELNRQSGKRILADCAKGVAEMLKGLAFECGTQLKFQNKLEKAITENLYRSGITISELFVCGDNDLQSISLILTGREFSLSAVQKIIEKTVGRHLFLDEKCFITDEKQYLRFKKASKYDAVFGVSSLKKDGSDLCGDTHAVSRLREDKFLVALSDGMGSGDIARSVSSDALSLIESFYKAGLSTDLIMNSVNKLLNVGYKDTFTALDVIVVDLKSPSADFIKYGSPYGFIISENSVRIVESSSLPMGVLDEIHPSVASINLQDGDVLLMITDGISDSFGSSSDVLDFLRTLPAKNPQSLTDGILQQAVQNSGGKKNDDMTAMAVRIFKKEQSA